MAVYGVASLTGGWLGTPPWWERPASDAEKWDLLARWAIEVGTTPRGDLELRLPGTDIRLPGGRAMPAEVPPTPPLRVARENREATSAAVVAVGLLLAVIGAWPRRRAGAAT